MKNIILTLIFALAAMTFCEAQKIETKNVFGGYKYTQDGERMTMGALVKTMKSNPEASALMKKAQTNNTFALVIAAASGVLIGRPLGTAIAGGDANWTLAGIGAGLLAIGIPLSSSANKKAQQAVKMYNSSLTSIPPYEKKSEVKIIASSNGFGLSISF